MLLSLPGIEERRAESSGAVRDKDILANVETLTNTAVLESWKMNGMVFN